MITTTLTATMGVTVLFAVQTFNPIKVSLSVLMVSTMMFLIMGMEAGMVWFSMILLMLFMGGIIMIFMILSSILPNEKSLKSSVSTMTILFLVLMSSLGMKPISAENVALNSKTFLVSGMNFFLMMSVVLFYFVGSLSILSSEQTPMRTIMCNKTLIL